MISIYNDKFTTPGSRVPYFIEVYRCVEADQNCHSNEYPVPSNKTEIEIVVPDLTNTYRDPLKKLFYKYVVYNHTTCKCGKLEERKLYEEIKDNEGKIWEAWFRSTWYLRIALTIIKKLRKTKQFLWITPGIHYFFFYFSVRFAGRLHRSTDVYRNNSKEIIKI